jgi:hypothetical protein
MQGRPVPIGCLVQPLMRTRNERKYTPPAGAVAAAFVRMNASYSQLVQSGSRVGVNAVSLAPRDVSAVRVFAMVHSGPLFPLSALSASSLPRATMALRAEYASVICRPSQRVCKWMGTSGTGDAAAERENEAAASEGGGAELGLSGGST